MKLVSWNVNGLRSCLTKGFLEYVKQEDPDIVCLQETKLQPEQAVFELEGYHRYFHSADKKGYSGTAVLTSGELESAGESAHAAESSKIIYTANLTLESKDYDAARAALDAALAEAGGYMESSDEYANSGSRRSLSLTLRVPQENYESFLAAVAATGNVTYKSQQAEDVTTQYMDIEARLSNLTAQRTRLQELQASAENLADLLEIESSLSDVQYQLESWQSQLNWYSQQAECSTVYLSLSEVKEYSPTEESYLSQLSSALRNGWSGFVSGLQQLTVWVVGVWPLLTLMAAAALIVHLVRRRTHK